MTGREKIEAAFSANGTPEIPAVICYEGIFHRDHYADLTRHPWWALESGDLDLHLAVYRDFIRHVGQDWIHLPQGPSEHERRHVLIEERPDGVYRVDRSTGGEQRLEPPPVGGRHIPTGPRRPAPASREEVDAALPLPSEAEVLRPLAEGRGDLARRLLQTDAAPRFPLAGAGAPLWGCMMDWSFDTFMPRSVEDPALTAYACRRRAERTARGLVFAARLGARGVWIEECWTDLVGPESYRRFNLPGLRHITEAARSLGLFTIHYYCGDPADRMNLLLDTGADALALEESKKGFRVDIAEVADFVRGRKVLLGNLDAITLLERGDDAALRAEIARQIAAGRRNGSRFILSIGSPVTPRTRVARVRRYLALARRLGRRA